MQKLEDNIKEVISALSISETTSIAECNRLLDNLIRLRRMLSEAIEQTFCRKQELIKQIEQEAKTESNNKKHKGLSALEAIWQICHQKPLRPLSKLCG